MNGELDLQRLLSTMRPELDPEPYVFCCFSDMSFAQLASHDPVALIAEAEGVTAILPLASATALGQDAPARFQRITLTIHSSLEAVGLTAAFAAALTRHGISANVVAGYYHDHIFVPDAQAVEAMSVLRRLSAEAR